MVATLTVTELDMLGFRLLLPEYDAVILSVPAGSEEVASVAFPPDNVTGELRLVPLTRNCIVPVADEGDTMAVKFTDLPNGIEVAFELKVVVEEARFTFCTSIPLTLGSLCESPRYRATMLCNPTDNDDVENVVLPVMPNVPVPSVVGGLVLVSLNCTVPVALFGVTKAVNFTR